MRTVLAALAISAATCGATAAVHGQSLEPGTWTGTIAPPGSNPFDVTYDVVVKGDTLTITVHAPPGDRPFHDIKTSENELTFWFEPGPRVDCVLAKQEDGSYAGDCVDRDGSVGHLTMVPPKEDAERFRM